MCAGLREMCPVEFLLVAPGHHLVASARRFEARGEHISVGSAPRLAYAEIGIVVFAAARLADEAQHMFGPIGEMGFQPLGEEIFHFKGQSQEYVMRLARPGRVGLVENLAFEVEAGGQAEVTAPRPFLAFRVSSTPDIRDPQGSA